MEQDDSRLWGGAARFPVLPSPRRWTSDPPDTSLFSTLRLWRAFELWFPNSPSDFIAELPFQRQASRRGLSAAAPQALPPEFFQLLSTPPPQHPWSQPFPAAASCPLRASAPHAVFSLSSFVAFAPGVSLIQTSSWCLHLEFGTLIPGMTNGLNNCFPYLTIISTRAGLFSVLYS